MLRGERGCPTPGETSQVRLPRPVTNSSSRCWAHPRPARPAAPPSQARGAPHRSGPARSAASPPPCRALRDSPEISAWGTPLRLKPLAPYSCRTSAQLLALLPLSPRAGAEATHSSQNPHGKKRILLRWPRHLPCEGQSQGPAAGRRLGSAGRRGAGRLGVRGAAPPPRAAPAGRRAAGGRRGNPGSQALPLPAACGEGADEFNPGAAAARRRGKRSKFGRAASKPRSVTA